MSQLKTWFSENSTLVAFLGAQTIAIIVGAASLLTYAVQLENRVFTMEHRGAEYTVARMQAIEHRLTVTERDTATNADSIRRIVEVLTRDLPAGSNRLQGPR
jgi:hypothetical protein